MYKNAHDIMKKMKKKTMKWKKQNKRNIENDLDFVKKKKNTYYNCTQKKIGKKHTKMLLLVSPETEITSNFYLI